MWQKAVDLVTALYRISKSCPKDETYGLTGQLRRCAVSVPSNIAEGYVRNSTSDYVRFLRMASGSLYEMQTQIQIALNLRYLKRCDFDDLDEASREIERMLSSLIRKIEERRKAEGRRCENRKWHRSCQ